MPEQRNYTYFNVWPLLLSIRGWFAANQDLHTSDQTRYTPNVIAIPYWAAHTYTDLVWISS